MSVVRYGVHSVGGFAFNVLLLAVFVELAGMHAALAPILSVAVTFLAFFPIADRWVFTDRGGSLVKRFLAYVSVLSTAKLFSYAGYLVLLLVGLHYLVAWLVASGVIFLASYRSHRITRQAVAG